LVKIIVNQKALQNRKIANKKKGKNIERNLSLGLTELNRKCNCSKIWINKRALLQMEQMLL